MTIEEIKLKKELARQIEINRDMDRIIGEKNRELAIKTRALRNCFTCGPCFAQALYERALDEAAKELEE